MESCYQELDRLLEVARSKLSGILDGCRPAVTGIGFSSPSQDSSGACASDQTPEERRKSPGSSFCLALVCHVPFLQRT